MGREIESRQGIGLLQKNYYRYVAHVWAYNRHTMESERVYHIIKSHFLYLYLWQKSYKNIALKPIADLRVG
jgi:hypothetical protein